MPLRILQPARRGQRIGEETERGLGRGDAGREEAVDGGSLLPRRFAQCGGRELMPSRLRLRRRDPAQQPCAILESRCRLHRDLAWVHELLRHADGGADWQALERLTH